MSDFVEVAQSKEIPAGEGRSFEVGDRVVGIFNINGRFTAIDDLCPHMGASLSAGHLEVETETVACPWHAWRFHVCSGAWMDNPRVSTDRFELKIDGERILIRVDSEGNPLVLHLDSNKTTEEQDSGPAIPES